MVSYKVFPFMEAFSRGLNRNSHLTIGVDPVTDEDNATIVICRIGDKERIVSVDFIESFDGTPEECAVKISELMMKEE